MRQENLLPGGDDNGTEEGVGGGVAGGGVAGGGVGGVDIGGEEMEGAAIEGPWSNPSDGDQDKFKMEYVGNFTSIEQCTTVSVYVRSY